MKKNIFIIIVFFIFTLFIFPQNITVTEPDPGETWYKGSTYNITWTSSGCTDNAIKINIFKNSVVQSNFVEQLTSNDTGSKSWTIPGSYVTGNYVIRIKTDDGVCIGDSGVFSIADQQGGTLTVTEPDPGETWYKGESHNITWNSSNCQDNNILINIFRNSIVQSNFVEQLTSSNTGSKNWFIPANYVNGNYIMRIKTSDGNCIGDSGLFLITNNPGSTPPPISAQLQTTAPKIGSQLPRTGAFIQGGPDLYIKSMQWSPKENIVPWTKVRCYVEIGNKGKSASKYCNMHLKLTNDQGGEKLLHNNISALAPGASVTRKFHLYGIDNKGGEYTALAIADPKPYSSGEGMITRINNKKFIKYNVKKLPQIYHCVVKVQNFKVLMTFKNIGQGNMEKFTAYLWVKVEGIDKTFNSYSTEVPAINPGQTKEVIFSVKFLHPIAIHPIWKNFGVKFKAGSDLRSYLKPTNIPRLPMQFLMKAKELFQLKNINKCKTD